MPCVECDKNEEENRLVKLRFTGGSHRPFAEQGPYRTCEPGKIYEVVARAVDLPFWEAVTEQELAEAEIESEEEPVEETKGDPAPDEDTSSPPKPRGLTREFTGEPRSPEQLQMDRFESMEDELLKTFINLNGGKVDGRWGRDKLIEAALKLQ